MIRIKLALIFGGIALIAFGVQEWRLASGAKSEPHALTCADLEKNGPGDNAHVKLSKFILCEQSFVYEQNKGRLGSGAGSWSKVYVPAVPVDGEYVKMVKDLVEQGKIGPNGPLPTPNDVRVIVKSSHVSNEQEMSALAARDEITGVITNKIESLGSKEKKMLEESYPGIDFSRCYIFDHDRKPADATKLFGMIGGGLGLGLLGGVWTLAGRKQEA